MPSIPTSSAPSSSALPLIGAPAAVPGTMPGTVATSGSNSSAAPTNLFTQLLAMLAASKGAPLQVAPSEITEVSLDGQGLEGVPETPAGEHDSDDTDGDDEASALAALLAFAPMAPITQPVTTPGELDTTSDSSSAVALSAEQLEGDIAKAALEQLAGGDRQDKSDKPTDPLLAATAAPANDSNAKDNAATQSAAQANGATPMHALLANHALRDADAVAPTDSTLRSPVGSHAWKDELGTQLTWMAMNGRETASLKLSPEHLGPLEVRISVKEGDASVFFSAANSDTRSALEQSMPRLRELFAAQGMSLTDAGVSRDSPRQPFKPSSQGHSTRGSVDAVSSAPVTSVSLSRLGLVDTYV